MKILQVVSSLDISAGGPSKSVSDLSSKLADKGHHITLLTGFSSDPYLHTVGNESLKVVFEKSSRFRMRINSLDDSEGFEILHGHGLWQLPVHQLAFFSRSRNKPYIISPRGMLEPWALNHKWFKKKIAMLAFQRRDLDGAVCLHATSQMEAENSRNLGFKNPIAVIPNGLDLSEYNLSKSSENNEKKKVLFFSRIHQKKGIELLIKAWINLDKKVKRDWIIEIAGDGEDKYIESLKKLITSSGLGNEVSFTGPKYREDKYLAFNQADLFVLPTYSENFGIVIAESLASGIPVITTKGTPWEEINRYNAGCWIDLGVEPLREALEKMMSLSDSDRIVMGLNGRKLVEKNYSITSTAAKMDFLYNWILNGGSKPEFIC